MRHSLFFYILVLTVGLLTGCSQSPHAGSTVAKASAQPLVPYVESTQLATVILKPERKLITSSRDPFMPVLAEEITPDGDQGLSGQAGEGSDSQIALMGVIKLGENYFAYLKTGAKTGVYQVQDKVGAYTVEHIDIDKIVLKSGDNEIVRKRGKT